MNFDLSDEHEAMIASVTSLLERSVDRSSRVASLSDAADVDVGLWKQLVATGAAGLVVPESYGGSGLGLLEAALTAQAIGAAAASVPFSEHTLGCLAITLGATEEQKQRWLPALASGAQTVTVAFAEPDGQGWMPSDWQLSGRGTMSGRKSYVPHAASADLLVLGLRGGALAVVSSGAGVQTQRLEVLDGTRSLYDLELSDAPATELEHVDGKALFDAALILVAADAFGGAEACLQRSVEYAGIREQYGVPIGSFQAVKHQLADLAVELEQSRALWWYAAHAWDTDAADVRRTALLAKSYLCDRFVQTARACVEVHGGIGFTWEYDLHVWLRRAYADAAFLGDGRRIREVLAETLAPAQR